MNELPLTVALCDYDHTRDLVMGRVKPLGIRLTCLTLTVEEIFHRFLHYQEWEVSELSFAKYASFRAKGDDRYIGLPIFPSRVFRHNSLYVREGGKVKAIGDLAARKIGIPEWAQTAAVYSRGFLQHQYGIDLRGIEWVQAGVNQAGRAEKVELRLPDGIKVTRITDRSLNEMLLKGDIDAVMTARAPAAFTEGDPAIRRLLGNAQEVEEAYYRDTGIFPIMHIIVMRKEVLDAAPWAARNLYNAFEEARRRAIARIMDLTVSLTPIPWGADYAHRGLALMGEDYFPYGIEANRTTLEAFLSYAHEQGVCERKLAPEELFPPQMKTTHKV